MDKTSLIIKERLEMSFSMPFDVTSSIVDGETHYTCVPSNENESYFSIAVYIHNQIRLVLEIAPEKHGGYILDDMAIASSEKKMLFFQYKQMLEDKGAKVNFQVNHAKLTEENWPGRWKSFSSKITKVPIPDDERDTFEFIIEWLQHGINLIFTLLNIVDIGQDNDDLQPKQTEGTPSEIRSVRYERNPINRQLCLYRKGYTCAVCGMDFYDVNVPSSAA
jgi:5-methylcytosine-specific restriction protein A